MYICRNRQNDDGNQNSNANNEQYAILKAKKAKH